MSVFNNTGNGARIDHKNENVYPRVNKYLLQQFN